MKNALFLTVCLVTLAACQPMIPGQSKFKYSLAVSDGNSNSTVGAVTINSLSSTADSITVKINNTPDATSYVYTLYKQTDGTTSPLSAIELKDTQHTFSGLTGNTHYKLSLFARIGGLGDGPAVFEEIKTQSSGPTAPPPQPAPPPEPEVVQPPDTNGRSISLEDFGGLAYYKRFDGGLRYTPLGNGTTRISYEGAENVFTNSDLGKSFVGLFVHQNPDLPEATCSDEYYPGLANASRYSKVVNVENSKNIIVDFEFNGGSAATPRGLSNQKGYVFFDNSNAFASMMKYFFSAESVEEEILFQPYGKNGILSKVYVVPQISNWQTTNKAVKLWTGTKQRARLKIGKEDHFKWGNSRLCYKQSGSVFNLGRWAKNFIIHNLDLIPPHRKVVETEVARTSLFTNDPNNEGQNRIVGVINNESLVEKREIGANLTHEKFYTFGIGTLYGNGSFAGSGAARDVSDYFYLLLKNTEHSGGGYLEYKSPRGAAGYLVMDNVNISFDNSLGKASFKTKARLTTDKSGFPAQLQQGSHYNEYVAHVVDPSTPFYLLNNYSITDGSSHNRSSVLQIDSATFTLPKRTYWANVHDTVFSEGQPTHTWNLNNGFTDEFTASKHLLFVIPKRSKIYRISRNYRLTNYNYGLPGSQRQWIAAPPTQSTNINNQIRSFINYSVVKNKLIESIDPKSIPANAKPIEFQAGDKFKIVGYGDTVYTIKNKKNKEEVDEGWAWEIASNRSTFYAYAVGILDKNLPSNLPQDFEIEIVHSSAEYLLDGEVRDAYIAFKADQMFIADENSKFGDFNIISGAAVGHNFYNHRELSLWIKDTKIESGFYRDSTNSLDGSLYNYSKAGYVFINSSGFVDQFLSVGAQTFSKRDILEQKLNLNVPGEKKAKLRLYNSQNINSDAGVYLERYGTSDQAPVMPAACQEIVNGLPN